MYRQMAAGSGAEAGVALKNKASRRAPCHRRCQMRAEIPPNSQTQSAISNRTIYDP